MSVVSVVIILSFVVSILGVIQASASGTHEARS